MRRPRIRIRWKKRTSRWVIGAAVLFFVSLFALQLVLMNYTKSILQNVLNLQIQQLTGGEYVSSFDEIEISYTRKNFVIKNLHLSPQQPAEKLGLGSPNAYDIFVPEVRINGINLRKAYLHQFLDIESLLLIEPVLHLSVNLDTEENMTRELLKKELYKLLPPSVNELRIGQIKIKDATLSLSTLKNQRNSTLKASYVHTELSNFHLKAANADEPEKIFFTENFFFAADSVEGILSNQLYQLQLGSVKISSKDSSAFASKVTLKPLISPQQAAGDSSVKKLYSLDFPQIYLYGLSFNDLYQTKDLLAKEVTIISPSLHLYNLHPLKEGEKENFRLENLYPAIDKVLNSIQVKDVYLRNGLVRIDELDKNLRNKLLSQVSLAHVRNFLLDSTASKQTNKLLYSDEISFQLQNYSLRLSDDLHLLKADKLALSSAENFIRADNFHILPDSSSSRMQENIPHYNAKAVNINISGIDFLQAYNQNNLYIDSLLLDQPNIDFSSRQAKETFNKEKETGFKEEDLYGLIKDYLFTLQIKQVVLKQGRLNIHKAQEKGSGAFATNIRRARLWDFRLDSTSAYQMNKLFYANDFEVEIADYAHDLPDNIHKVTAATIAISTLSDRILIKGVRIRASNYNFPYANLKQSPVKTLLNLEVPELRLEGVDILKAYLRKELEVKQVYIPAPAIAMGTLIDQKSERTDLIKSSALYDIMKEYLELIQVEDLNLQEGIINLAFYDPNGLVTVKGGQTDIKIDNFRFDSLTSSNPKRLFFADNVQVQVAGFETQLSDDVHIISADNLMVSTNEQEIKATNVALSTSQESFTDEELLLQHRKKGYVKLFLPELSISGLNFDKAYYDESLTIDSVLANEPVVTYTYIPQASLERKKEKVKLRKTDIYENIAPYLQEMVIANLQMKNGRFYSFQQENNSYQKHIELEGVSLNMQHFKADSAAVYDNKHFFYTDNISLVVEKYQQALLDKEHVLRAEDLMLSTQNNRIEARDIRLEPQKGGGLHYGLQTSLNGLKASPQNQYFIHLPALKIDGINFDHLFRDNRLYIEELSLQDPSIEVQQFITTSGAKELSGKEKLNNYKLDKLLQGNLASFTVKEARIRNGQGKYTLYGDQQKFQVRSREFEALVENFQLNSDESESEKPFNADNVSLTFKSFERKLPDSLHMLSIGEIRYSSQQKLLEVENAAIIPRTSDRIQEKMKVAGTDKLYHINLPLSKVKGFEAEKLGQDSLLLDYILFQNPSIKVFEYPIALEQKKGNEQEKNIQQVLKEFKLVQTDSIVVEGASATYTSFKLPDTSQLHLANIDAIAYNFRLDSLTHAEQNKRLYYSDRLKAQLTDYRTTVDEGLYELKIKKVQLDSRDKIVLVDSIELTPLTDRETFASQKGYETDQFTFRNQELKIKNLDFQRLKETGDIYADSLLLDGFYLLVHRDKSQPYPQDHYPKMPQDILRNLKPELLLLGVSVKNGYLGYSERAKGARDVGFIDLTDLRIVSDTISNIPGLLENGLTTNIFLDTYLMGTGHLTAQFNIPLGDSLNRHSFSGSLDEMYLPDFNPILEKTVFIKIKNGLANKITFTVEADKYGAEGVMEFAYEDLKVALVNKKTGKTGGMVNQVGSLIANMFVVNSSNVEGANDPLRKGDMHFARDESRSTINFWIKTLVNGFKSSIGI